MGSPATAPGADCAASRADLRGATASGTVSGFLPPGADALAAPGNPLPARTPRSSTATSASPDAAACPPALPRPLPPARSFAGPPPPRASLPAAPSFLPPTSPDSTAPLAPPPSLVSARPPTPSPAEAQPAPDGDAALFLRARLAAECGAAPTGEPAAHLPPPPPPPPRTPP